MNRRGAVLPVALVLSLAAVFFSVFCAEAAAVAWARQKASTACDFSLLSAMRVRVKSLETIAARWDEFGGDISLAGGALSVDSGRWPNVLRSADALSRALPGYQGRVSSSLTVSLAANGFPSGGTRQTAGNGLRLGLTSVTEPVLVGGFPAVLNGAWFARTWAPGEAAPRVGHDVTLTLDWPVTWRGGAASVRSSASARTEWDVDGGDPVVAAAGRGGFSRNLTDAVSGGLFVPNQFPFFRALLRRNGT